MPLVIASTYNLYWGPYNCSYHGFWEPNPFMWSFPRVNICKPFGNNWFDFQFFPFINGFFSFLLYFIPFLGELSIFFIFKFIDNN